MPKFLKTTLFIAAVMVVIGFIYLKWTAADEGDPAPEIQAVLVNGRDFKLSDLQGDYVLLSFWGSWCGPCRVETPYLIDLHKRFKKKLKVVSIALEKDAESTEIVGKQIGFTWKYQIVEESSFVMMSSTAQKYGVTSIPTLFLISPEGVLLGQKTLEEVEKILEKI